MKTDEIKAEKKKIREEAVRLSKALDEDYVKYSNEKIAENIMSLDEYRKASVIFCFISMPFEIDTHTVVCNALSSGKRVCVPKCSREESGIMDCFEISSYDDLEPGRWGIPEPKSSCWAIAPSEIDFAVIPCSTCSHSGSRLGFGGGYYDRYLEHAEFASALICREKIMREDIPEDEHDIRFRTVVTEKKVYRL
jgi:5-formyltetrahydrofolate cyclo-ligase